MHGITHLKVRSAPCFVGDATSSHIDMSCTELGVKEVDIPSRGGFFFVFFSSKVGVIIQTQH